MRGLKLIINAIMSNERKIKIRHELNLFLDDAHNSSEGILLHIVNSQMTVINLI